MRKTFQLVLGGAALVLATQNALAADWFGLPLPTGLSDPDQPVLIIGTDFAPLPVVYPPGVQRKTELQGEKIFESVKQITGFSKASRARGEKLWGRIAGMPALLETNEWVAAQFRNAGIAQVGVEQHTGSLTIPTGWSVTVHGPGPDIVLQSSMPIRTSPSISGTLNAPLVFVGAGSSAEMAGKSVQGKVAVIHKKPNPGLFFARFSLTDLIAAQPAAILVTIELPGNMMSQDSCASGNIPCFYLGGADGQFLEAALAAVDRTGAAQLTASVQLTMTTYPSAVVSNAYAFIPGMNNRRDRRGENIMISAHADAWFDGAGDNADGLAVLVALARHYSQPQNRLSRDLVLVATSGHHTIGGGGVFLTKHPEFASKSVFLLNLEHVAQLLSASTTASLPASVAGYRPLTATPIEETRAVGIVGATPLITAAFGEAATLFQENVPMGFDPTAPGEIGQFGGLAGVPKAQIIHAGPFYHTSGDVYQTISVPGLERAAHFFDYILHRIDAAPKSQLIP